MMRLASDPPRTILGSSTYAPANALLERRFLIHNRRRCHSPHNNKLRGCDR